MLNKLRNKKNNKGFTLVELLVVIAIIGILAVVAVPALFKNIDKSKAVQVTTNINAIKTEILAEYADGKTAGEIEDASDTIVEIVQDSEKKAGEEYSIAVNTDGKLEITVSTTDGSDSNVLGRVNKQYGADSDVAIDSVSIEVTN